MIRSRRESSMSDVESAKYWLSWIEFGSTIALLLVALGVGFEFVADRVATPLRRKIEMAREADISQANARAKKLNEMRPLRILN